MRGLARVAVLCACAFAAFAQEPGLKPEIIALARIKAAMRDNLSSLPNYTCLQTIERSHRMGNRGRYELLDTLRMEVAMVEGKEMYAWPGARQFDEKPLAEMVGRSGGAIGTGAFGLLARMVFEGNGAHFEYRGEDIRDGRKLARYDFHAPLPFSGYNISVWDRGSATTAFRGSFWVDPASLDLVRLEVHALDIPPALGLLDAWDAINYQRVAIGESRFLLPLTAELGMVDFDGSENRNRMELSGCRKYTGESNISFGEVPLKSAPPAPPTPIHVPLGVSLLARLNTDIVGASAAVGDPVSALVESPARFQKRVVIPKGAVLAGRITRLERQDARSANYSFFVVGLEFTSISFDGGEGEIATEFGEAPPNLGKPPNAGEVRAVGPGAASPGRNVFFVFQHSLHLSRGLPLRLRTVAPAKENP